MQNFRTGREAFQQLKQLPQAFLHKMVGSIKCHVKETEVLSSEVSDIYIKSLKKGAMKAEYFRELQRLDIAGITLIVTSLITTIRLSDNITCRT